MSNYATTSGGSLYIRGFTSFRIHDMTQFSKGQAIVSGGDIFATESDKNLTLDHILIENQVSADSIYLETVNLNARKLEIKSKYFLLTLSLNQEALSLRIIKMWAVVSIVMIAFLSLSMILPSKIPEPKVEVPFIQNNQIFQKLIKPTPNSLITK